MDITGLGLGVKTQVMDLASFHKAVEAGFISEPPFDSAGGEYGPAGLNYYEGLVAWVPGAHPLTIVHELAHCCAWRDPDEMGFDEPEILLGWEMLVWDLLGLELNLYRPWLKDYIGLAYRSRNVSALSIVRSEKLRNRFFRMGERHGSIRDGKPLSRFKKS